MAQDSLHPQAGELGGVWGPRGVLLEPWRTGKNKKAEKRTRQEGGDQESKGSWHEGPALRVANRAP